MPTITASGPLPDHSTRPDDVPRPGRLLLALAVAAPLVEALASGLHPELPDDADALLAVVDATSRWYVMTLVALLACALLPTTYVTLGRLLRQRSSRLAFAGMAVGTIGIVLMAAMQGFKLFLPTLADVGLDDGSTAVGDYIESPAFAPMIAAFVARALAWVIFAIAVVKAKAAPPLAGVLMGGGAIAAFQLPAGPDAFAWLAVAAGMAIVVRRHQLSTAVSTDD